MSEKYADVPVLTQRFDRAMGLALDHHRMHLRKGTELPYMTHLLAVTASVLEMGGNEDEAIAALLHDAVEDGGGPLMQKRIESEFGDAVGEMVAAHSDTDTMPKPPWEARKKQYLVGMTSKSAGALRVSLADKLHNARSILADHADVGDALWSRFSASAGQTAWYYRSLAHQFEAQTARMGPGAAAGIAKLNGLASDIAAAAAGDEVSARGEDYFLVDWVHDAHARRALLDNGLLLVDNFREAVVDGRAVDHACGVVPTVFVPAIDATVAVRLYAAAAALMARLSCGYAATCVAEEMLGAHLVIQCIGDLERMPEWEHLTDGERERAVRALDGVFDLFQDDEAISLYGSVTAEHTTPEEAVAEVQKWFQPFAGVHVTGHLDEDRSASERWPD